MPEIVKYKNTGLEYIEGKGRFMFRQKGEKSGVLITHEEFTDWDSRNILFSQILGIKNDKDRGGFDFSYAAETGRAIKLTANSKKNTTIDAKEKLPKVEEPAAAVPLVNPKSDSEFAFTLEELKEVTDKIEAKPPQQQAPTQMAHAAGKQKKNQSIVSIHTSRNVMMGIMLIVGVLSLVMSTYHIIAYLIEPRGPFVAWASAIAMTLFSSSAFTTGRYFWFLSMDKLKVKEALKNGLIAWAFWLMGACTVIYAMFATMDVNFTDFKNRQQAVVAVAVVSDSTVKNETQKDADYRAEAKRLDGILAAADAEKAPWLAEVGRLTKVLNNPDLTDEERAAAVSSRASAQYRANVIEDRVKSDRSKRSVIGDRLVGTGDAAVSAENVVKADAEKGTFFALLHDIFNWDVETLKLILYVIPAVFYDLMSPFALTVVMILEEKREEDDTEALSD